MDGKKSKLVWEFGRTTITVLVENNDWASIEATVRADVMRKLVKQIMTRLGWIIHVAYEINVNKLSLKGLSSEKNGTENGFLELITGSPVINYGTTT